MPTSNITFEEGEGISVGAHGANEFVFEEGVEVRDAGGSTLVFESGSGLGGVGSLVVAGTEIGFFNSGVSHSEFFGYDSTVFPNARGLFDRGVLVEDGNRKVTIFGHYDQTADTYAVGTNYWQTTNEVSDSYSFDTLWIGFGSSALNPTDPIFADNPPSFSSTDEVYTTFNGDPVSNHGFGWDNGDGVGYEFNPGQSLSITLELASPGTYTSGADTEDGDNNAPSQIFGNGPDGSTTFSYTGYGQQVNIGIEV